jgi:muramoyltetrapeptide carboxypeptidase
MIKPPRLAPGDTVGIVTPASPPVDPEGIDRALATVERLGFKPLLAPNARKRLGYLAGTDAQRAEDLMYLFARKNVRALFCLRGGYGVSRLLSRLDYTFIRQNPKILAGYSDITALHCALQKKAGLISFHAPMLGPDLSQSTLPDFTLDSFIRTLTEASSPGGICHGHAKKGVTVVAAGVASGRLVGGNLTLLCSTLGTPYQPSFRRRVLFLEEIDEAPYRVDRLLTQLLNAGLLQQVVGIAIGSMKGCLDSKARHSHEYRQNVEDVLKDRLQPLEIPVLSGLPFGHTTYHATLPCGAKATIDTSVPDLFINESAVC